MHGIGQPPRFQLNGDLMHYLFEAGIPYSRLYDVQGVTGSNLHVDVPNIFRDFDADEPLPSPPTPSASRTKSSASCRNSMSSPFIGWE